MKSLDNDLMSLIWGMTAGLVSSFFVALYPLLLKRSMVSLDNWQISIHVNLVSLIWFTPLIAYEIQQGMLDNKFLYDRNFWLFNFATATVGFVLNIASMLQVGPRTPGSYLRAEGGGFRCFRGYKLAGALILSFGGLGLGVVGWR